MLSYGGSEMRAFRLFVAGAMAAAGLSVVTAQSATSVITANDSFESCVRGTPATTCSNWVPGNVTGFFEDQVVPQRVVAQVSGPGTHTFGVNYQDVSGGIHKIDYLASWDYTQNAGVCTGLVGAALTVCNAGSPAVGAMASDPSNRGSVVPGYTNSVQQRELPGADRQWKIYGATQITGSTVSHPDALTGVATVTFTTAAAGPVVIMFGAHVALTGPASNPRAWAQGGSEDKGTVQLALTQGGNKTNNLKFGTNTPPPPPPTFTISKAATPNATSPGGTVTYTVTVTNTGGQPGPVTFTDNYDDNVTGLTTPAICTPGSGQMTCTTPPIAAGDQYVMTYTANMPATFSGSAGGSGCSGTQYAVSNTATFASGTVVTTGQPNAATATVCVNATADFTITKTPSDDTPQPNSTVNYVVTVTNNGTAAGPATFVDDADDRITLSVPAGCSVTNPTTKTYTCTTGSLAAEGGTQSFIFTATMPSTFDGGATCAGGYTVTNTVTLTGATPVAGNVCVQAEPVFEITKSAVDEANPGQEVTYTVTVRNTGAASGSTTVTDDYDNRLDPSVPAGCTDDGDELTCSTGKILAGGERVFSYTADMPTTFTGPSGGSGCASGTYPVDNTATLATGGSDSETVCIGAAPEFTIEKSVNDDSATPGQEITYTIQVSNIGPASGATSFTDVYDASITPSVPTGDNSGATCARVSGTFECSTGDVDSGDTVTFTYTAEMPTTFGPSSGGAGCVDTYPISNTATLTDGDADDAVVCVTANPDYTITKSADKTEAEAGETVTYTVTVTNGGAASGSTSFLDDFNDRVTPGDVTITPVSGGSGCSITGDTNRVLSCATGLLAANGGSQSFVYTVTLPLTFDNTDPAGGCGPGRYEISNEATLANGGAAAGVDVCVAAAPDLRVAKSADDTSPEPGDTITYTVTVNNLGTAAGATPIIDDFDDRLGGTLTVLSAPAGPCTNDGDTLTCPSGTVPALGSVELTYTVVIPSTVSEGLGGGTCSPTTYEFTNSVQAGGDLATATICVIAGPRFEISKSADPADAGPGDPVTYTVIVTNRGTAPGSTTWTDTFDDRITPSLPTFAGAGECTYADDAGPLRSYSCDTAVLAPDGGKQTFTYTHTMPTEFVTGDPTSDACDPGEYSVTNDASVLGGTDNDADSAVVCVDADPAFEVAKSVDDDEVGPGDTVTYTVTVENTGDAPGETEVTDSFDSRLDLQTFPGSCTEGSATLTCQTGTLEPGEVATFVYTAKVPSSFASTEAIGTGCAPDEYALANQVTVDVGGDTASETVCVATSPDLGVTKSADPTATIPGGVIDYTIEITNSGSAAGTTSFTDDYDAQGGTVSVSEPVFSPSASAGTCEDDGSVLDCVVNEPIEPGDTLTITYSITLGEALNGDSAGGACDVGFAYYNEVTLTDGAAAENTVCVDIAPAFVITKTVDNADPALGETVEYTVRVTNNGSAPGSTSFTDDYDPRLEPTDVVLTPIGGSCTDDGDVIACDTALLPAGSSQTFVYSAEIPTSFTGAAGGGDCGPGEYRIANTATLLGGLLPASQDVCVAAAPEFVVTKSVDKTKVGTGKDVVYTITLKNEGDAAGSTTFEDNYDNDLAIGDVVSDPSGADCSNNGDVISCETSTILAGGTQTFSYTATMPDTFTGASGTDGCEEGSFPIKNRVTAANDSTDAVTVCVAAAPVFNVVKEADTELVGPSGVITYTVTVSNTGDADGTTTFVDDFDDLVNPGDVDGCTNDGDVLTCTTEVLAPLDGSQVFTYSVTVPATFTGPSGGDSCTDTQFQIDNDVELANGTAVSEAVCVEANPAFTIVKSAEDTEVGPGETVNYTVTVTNTGDAPGSTSFTDTYDAGLTMTPPPGCTAGTNSFTCTTGSLEADEEKVYTYSAVVPETFGLESALPGCDAGEFGFRNTAGLENELTSSVLVCVAAAPAITITKAVDDDSPEVGQTLNYTVTVANGGTAASPPVSFTDDYTDTLTDVTVPAGCDQVNGTLECETGVIDAGEDQVFEYSATVPDAFVGDSGQDGCDPGTYPIANAVTADGVEGAEVNLCVPAAPEFTIEKSVDVQNVQPGDLVTYTLVVNNGGTASGSTSFTDNYDDRLIDTITVPDGCTDNTGTFTCTTGDILAGDSETFTYTAVMPETFTGDSGGGDCETTHYRVGNGVTLDGGSGDGQDVCVEAAPEFTVTKIVSGEAVPGGSVTYTVTVTNIGAAAGSTTFVDDYDDRLDPTVPDSCTKAGGELTCETGTLLSGADQEFVYTATLPATYSGASGSEPCGEGEYGVGNTVVIDGTEVASETVCVPAGPRFAVAKDADDTSAVPSQSVEYSVVVTNVGEVAGSTTFTDDYDDRLSPTVPAGCEIVEDTLECTTGDIEPGESKTFTYSAVMPASFLGASGGGSCATGTFPVGNTVTLANGETDAVEVCVAAAPQVSLEKSGSVDFTNNGDQVITYTLTYANTGAAEARDVVVDDPIPSGTAFISCTGGCTVAGSTATWPVGSVAPVEGTGTLVLKVKLITNNTCTIANTAYLKVGDGPTVASNTVVSTVTPQPDPSTGKSSGSATGLSIRTSGLLDLIGPLVGGAFTSNNTLALSRASSSQAGPGGPSTDSSSLLNAKIPSNGTLVSAGVLTTTSASTVTASPAEARQTTVSEVAGLCLVKVAGICTVESGTVRAVATTMANGSYAATSTSGSAIENLRVVNTAVPVNLNQTTTIPLNALVFGKGSYVAINERTGSSGLTGGKYVADQSVSMIHLKITGALGVQAVEIYVAQATAHSEFGKTLVCAGAKNQSVSGHAYTTRLYTGPLVADLLQGYAQISPLGGSEQEHIAEVVVPSTGVIVNAKVAASSTVGGFTPTSSAARSYAEVAGDGDRTACVLSYVTDCVAKATLIRSEASSLATSVGSTSNSAGTQFLGLSVFGIPIAGTPAPNTTLVLPGIGFIVLNEQFCDNGGVASGTCTGKPHSGITVRALRVVVTVANNILGLNPGVELVVAEAHADAMFSSAG